MRIQYPKRPPVGRLNHNTIEMDIKEFYLTKYSDDELGQEINNKATFLGLYHELVTGKQVYEYLMVYDSLVRERVFEELARIIDRPYDYVYNLWT